jgi:glycosyltransferase involved in cell wall biosynthesis
MRQFLVMVVSGVGMLGASAWLLLLAGFIIYRRSIVRLKNLPSDPPEGGWPTLAVIFAARNEAAMVEKATRSLLAQDYPGMELIAVDDRSTDGTGEILDALAREDPRLRVVHVHELPPGWLGKNHALQAAAGSTSAEWLLFTDADVVFAPGALRRSVGWACAKGLDHATLAPDTLTESFSERVFMTMFCLIFALTSPPWLAVDPRSKVAIGVGAFNLVRASAFRAIGGFQHIALSIDDDLRLGQALKFSGHRVGLALGQGDVSVRWHAGVGGMIRGLEKNFFAAMDFQLVLVPAALVFIAVIGVMPFVGLFVGPWWARAVCGSGIAAAVAILAAGRGQIGLSWYHALFLPFGALAFAVALLRSTYITLRNGGVDWRDHHYPLKELKDHVRRRNAWAKDVWRASH